MSQAKFKGNGQIRGSALLGIGGSRSLTGWPDPLPLGNRRAFPATVTGQWLGYSVKMASTDPYALVGAPRTLVGTRPNLVGDSAYFSKNQSTDQSWIRTNFQPTTGNQYGSSVDLTENGEWAVIGAPSNTGQGTFTVAQRTDPNTLTIREDGIVIPSSLNGDRSALSIATQTRWTPGTTVRIILGAPFWNTDGRVVVMESNSDFRTTWNLEASIESPLGVSTAWGSHVDMDRSGQLAVFSSPSEEGDSGRVRVIARDQTGWTISQTISSPDPDTGNFFGDGLALSEDGQWLVVGEPQALVSSIRTGRAWVFKRNRTNNQFELNAELFNPVSPTVGQRFGAAVAISGSNNLFAVGAPGAPFDANNLGWVHLYQNRNEESPLLTQSLTNVDGNATYQGFGHSVSLSRFGERLVVGTFDGGTNLNGGVQFFDQNF